MEGCIQGNIDVQSLCLKSTAVVEGNIRARFIEIQPKAVIRGNLVVDPAEGAVLPETEKKKPKEPPKKNTLFLVDPQMDKHATGATPVPGADEDSERIAKFILSDIKYIDNIVISLESRHVSRAYMYYEILTYLYLLLLSFSIP